MARDKNDSSDPVKADATHNRRAVVGLIGAAAAGAAASAAGILPAAAAEQTAARGRTTAALQKIIGNPELMNKLEAARDYKQRAEILAQLGVDGVPDPQEIYQTISQAIAKHVRPGSRVDAHTYGKNDWVAGGSGSGPLERPVEWVGAIAAAGAWAAAA